MRDIEWAEIFAGCVTLVVVATVMTIVNPLLFAAGGYFTGWVLSTIFSFGGQWVADGARQFGFEISLSSLPVMGAFLAFVGAFFKSSQTNNNKK